MAGKENQSEPKGRAKGPGSMLPPATRAGILEDLKAGGGYDQIAARHGVGRQTVYSMREAHADELPQWKRRTAGIMMRAAEKLAGRLEREAETGTANLQQQSIALGILSDKVALLREQPAQIIEHRHELGRTFGGWLGNAAQIPATSRTIAANVVEIGENPPERACLGKSGDGKQDGGDAEEGGGDEKSQPPSV